MHLARHTAERDEHHVRDASRLLQRLLAAAQDGGRTRSVIEILLLLALAQRAHGDGPAALVTLERAVTLAEPEGYVRIFVDEGEPMAALLREASQRTAATGYARQLLAAFGQTHGGTHATQGLVDPLSERELEVLRLLATDLNGPDIARQLVVSLNTVRTHTKHIYAKLGINSRRAAVRRAAELNLLSPLGNR